MGPQSESGRLSRRQQPEERPTVLENGRLVQPDSWLRLTAGDYWPSSLPINTPSLETVQARLASSRLCNRSLSAICIVVSTFDLREPGRLTPFTMCRTSRLDSASERYGWGQMAT